MESSIVGLVLVVLQQNPFSDTVPLLLPVIVVVRVAPLMVMLLIVTWFSVGANILVVVKLALALYPVPTPFVA